MAGAELAGDEGFDLKNQRLWCIFLMACSLGVTVYQVRATDGQQPAGVCPEMR